MVRGITEDDVFEVCNRLSTHGGFTLDEIRKALGNTGSRATISRHVKNWKILQRDKQEKTLTKKILEKSKGEETSYKEVSKIYAQIEQLATENFNVQSENQELKQEHDKLVKDNITRATRLETLEQVNQQLLDMHTKIDSRMEEFFKQYGKETLQELQEVNIATLDKVHELSVKSQDIWLKEKVKLNEAVNKNKQLLEENKKLQQRVLHLEKAVRPLKKAISYQKKLINQHVSFEKLGQVD